MIEPFIAPAVGALIGGAALWRHMRQRRFLRDALAQRGFHTIKTLFRTRFVAERGPFRAVVSTQTRNKKRYLKIEIHRTDGIIPPVRLYRQRALDGLLASDDVVIGDPPFDDALRAVGQVDPLLVVLTPPIRHELLMLGLKGDLTLEAGTFSYRTRYTGVQVIDFVDRSEALARKLLQAEAPSDILAERFVHETAPGVRARILRRALMRPERLGSDAIITRALDDEDSQVRLIAALHTGHTGVLRAALGDTRVRGSHAEVIAALSAKNDGGCEPLVLAAFDGGDDACKDAAIAWLARYGSALALTRLEKLSSAWLGDRTRKDQASEALAAIRARVGTLAGGEVSLDGGGEGALSLAADPKTRDE